MRGKAAVARAGRLPVGSGPGLYGYDYDKTAKCRTVRDSEASVVRVVRGLSEPWRRAPCRNRPRLKGFLLSSQMCASIADGLRKLMATQIDATG